MPLWSHAPRTFPHRHFNHPTFSFTLPCVLSMCSQMFYRHLVAFATNRSILLIEQRPATTKTFQKSYGVFFFGYFVIHSYWIDISMWQKWHIIRAVEILSSFIPWFLHEMLLMGNIKSHVVQPITYNKNKDGCCCV